MNFHLVIFVIILNIIELLRYRELYASNHEQVFKFSCQPSANQFLCIALIQESRMLFLDIFLSDICCCDHNFFFFTINHNINHFGLHKCLQISVNACQAPTAAVCSKRLLLQIVFKHPLSFQDMAFITSFMLSANIGGVTGFHLLSN